ncbi:MAG: hypothetical protein WAM90_11745 [Rhodanobacter sp.]
MKRASLSFMLLTIAAIAQAAAPARDPARVAASGKPDGAIPGWSISTIAPQGWTADCCTYAKAIGVDFVIYQGDWTGEPDRVMVLNVWPRKLPTLAAEWQADQEHYLQHDPLAKVAAFPVSNRAMDCHGLLYQGTDHIDDAVVFCDPGKAAGIRFSWSMTVAAGDAQRQHVTELFQRVIEKSAYMKSQPLPKPTDKAGQH